MVIRLSFVFFVSFLLSVAITALLLKKIKPCKGSVSSVGGIAMWFTFTITSLFVVMFDNYFSLVLGDFMVILITATFMFLAGVIDDKKELSASMQFLAQSIIAFFVIVFGLRTHIVGIGVMGNYIVTFLWIVGITNAFNHLDIVDGLAAGIAFICAITFCIVSLLTGNGTIAIIFALLAGSVLGFLRYNFPVAKVYMGNAGSHFLGFVLSTLSIMISYASFEKKIALLVPLIILGVPIFDTLFVMWMRILKRQYVWAKSDDHLALRLIAMGYSKNRTVICMFLFAFIFSVCAVALLQISVPHGSLFLLALAVLCFVLAQRMRKVVVKE